MNKYKMANQPKILVVEKTFNALIDIYHRNITPVTFQPNLQYFLAVTPLIIFLIHL